MVCRFGLVRLELGEVRQRGPGWVGMGGVDMSVRPGVACGGEQRGVGRELGRVARARVVGTGQERSGVDSRRGRDRDDDDEGRQVGAGSFASLTARAVGTVGTGMTRAGKSARAGAGWREHG